MNLKSFRREPFILFIYWLEIPINKSESLKLSSLSAPQSSCCLEVQRLKCYSWWWRLWSQSPDWRLSCQAWLLPAQAVWGRRSPVWSPVQSPAGGEERTGVVAGAACLGYHMRSGLSHWLVLVLLVLIKRERVRGEVEVRIVTT